MPPEQAARDLRRVALTEGPIDYVLVRRRGRRGIGLKVDETGLTVSAPVTMPLARVESFVRESESWIVRKVREWSTRRIPQVSFRDGALLPYLGGSLILRTVPDGLRGARQRGDELWAAGVDDSQVQRAVVAWYKRAARDFLGERITELAQRAGLPLPRLIISPARGRWGSCNSDREVRLAWRLMKAPPDLVDYVICHELAHLRHMDHSPRFWAEVERQCPGYRELRKRLLATDYLYRSF